LEATQREARVSERTAVITGAIAGAAAGIAVTYLFFTDRGRSVRARMEPAVDNLRDEFTRLQRTFEKVGAMAADGIRAFEEFNAARSQARFTNDSTAH
jgi:hypothetical protein